MPFVTVGLAMIRDPRAERAAATVVTTPRLRLDRTHKAGAIALPVAEETRMFLAAPAFLVFAVLEGTLSRHDRQVLGAARRLAGAQGGVVAVAVALSGDTGAAGADRELALGGYDLATLIAARAPRHVVFAETPEGGDLARRVAVALDEALAVGVEAVSATQIIWPVAGRRRERRAAPARLISIALDMIPPYAGPARRVESLEAPPAGAAREAGEIIPATGAVPLAEAGFVLAAGNGVTDFAAFLALAERLGATPGGSRVVCDAGLLPRAAQVGASGTVLTAETYFALGIAGAPQHLQGITEVGRVIAVNTDLHAAMVARAQLAIVADAQAVMRALLAVMQ